MGDETKVQMREVAKGAAAIGNVVERYMIRYLGPVGRKIAAANKNGRIMALIGVVAVILSLVLGLTSDDLRYGITHVKRGAKYVYINYEMKIFLLLIGGYILYKIGVAQKK
ncbi:MAG TPA: hypothetical protein VI956_05295 [Nitrospirota bacterium]|nr:hypothetical protein [Nitrospirota bacterium]